MFVDILLCPDWLFKKLSQGILPFSPTLPATSLRCYSSSYVVSRSIVAVVVNKLCSELVFVVNAAVATNTRQVICLASYLTIIIHSCSCSRYKHHHFKLFRNLSTNSPTINTNKNTIVPLELQSRQQALNLFMLENHWKTSCLISLH